MGRWELLEAEYDLRYRPAVGDTSYYRLDIAYNHLDERGVASMREGYRGDFRRVVDAVDQSGRVQETITWNNVSRRFAQAGTDLGEPEPLEWANGLSYPFSAEDRYEDFAWDAFEPFPKDLYGWFGLILVIDAHFEFDFLRSSYHGSIEKLRRIGDSVVSPDSGVPVELNFEPVVLVPDFNKQNLVSTFTGLTTRNGEPCGQLSFHMDASPFHMKLWGEQSEHSSMFAGTLTVRLADGALEHGEFDEWVFAPGSRINPKYDLSPIDENEFNGDI